MFALALPHKLVKQIRRHAREDLLDKLVGLGLSPEFQENAARIQTLTHLALVEARGEKRASRSGLASLLNGFEDHPAKSSEDPAEDVFVSTVSTREGQFRIFNGTYPGADYNLQRLLDAVLSQEFKYRESIARQCDALLRLSDAVAQRCGFAANEFSKSQMWRTDWPLSLPVLQKRGAAARFTDEDLSLLGIAPVDLEPFRVIGLDGLLDAPFGETLLNRWPVIGGPNGIHLPIPSFASPALRLYLAQAIDSGVVPRAAIRTFHDHQFSRWLGVDLPKCKAKPLEVEQLHLPEPHFDMPGGLSQAVLRFDEDKLAHLLVLHCSWRDPPDRNIHQRATPSAKFEKELAEYLRAVQKKLSKDLGVERGLTLVVHDSPGWSFLLSLPADFSELWCCTGFTDRNFTALLADRAFSLIDLWKMLCEVRELETKGVQMRAWPDMLNYWSIWRSMGSTFWPQTFDLRAFGAFAPDTSKIVETMRKVRLETSSHVALLPNGEWRRVERWVEELSPSGDRTKPLYLDSVAIVLGELRSVVETKYGPWWVASARPPFDPLDRQLLYLIWQASAEWLVRIAGCGVGRLPESTQPLELRILPVPESIRDAPNEIEFVFAEDSPVATIILPPSFPDKLMTVDNRGERLLVRALIDAVLGALRRPLSEETRVQWVSEVTADPNLKLIHVTPGGDHGFGADLLADKLSSRFLQQADLSRAERFMAGALEEMPADEIGKITKAGWSGAIARAVLHRTVDVHWHRCKSLLASLNREATLLLVSRLIEALHRERVQSERSGAARLRHYINSPEYADLAMFAVGRRDRSFHAYRVVAEMALCECASSGGRDPGLTDIDILSAEVDRMIEMAHNSDAIDRGLIEPEIRVRSDGGIDLPEGGALAFTQAYIASCLRESLALDADAYPALFEVRREEHEAPIPDDDPFLRAFHAEFGLGLKQAAEISNMLQAIAVDQHRDAASMSRSELEMLVAKRSPAVGADTLAQFLRTFGLQARDHWDKPPVAPYTHSDVWPWLFERRLSLMLRPVLIVPNKPDDPKLIFGVRQLDMGILYASTLLEIGGWPRDKLSSAEARAYVSEESNRRGRAFESEIAELMRGRGWQIVEAVAMKRLGAPKQLGDLDVFAASPDGRRWLIIECKWFGAARTPREIANWLQDFRGHNDDKLDRHLKRAAWVRMHRELVVSRLGLRRIPELIESKIVTTRPVPLALQKGLPLGSEVLTKRELRDLIASA